MRFASISAHYPLANVEDEVEVLGHHNEGIHADHRVVGANAMQQLLLDHGAQCGETHIRCSLVPYRYIRVAFHYAQHLAAAVCYFNGDMIQAFPAVVIDTASPSHVVLAVLSFFLFHKAKIK